MLHEKIVSDGGSKILYVNISTLGAVLKLGRGEGALKTIYYIDPT